MQAQSNARSTSNQWNRSTAVGVEPKSEPASHSASPVSQDLLQIYSQTKQVRSEAEVTAIARACAKVISNSGRSQVDQDYATSLMAWALNRRGEMRSEQAEALVRAGSTESASKLDAQAADDFATAVKYAPESWRHRHNFAISLAMKADYARAIEQLGKAIELNPQYANARFNRAELHLELGNYSEAEQDYTAAIGMAEDAQYFNSRGHCRFLMQSYQQAMDDYRRAVDLSSGNATYATDLGDACQFVGQWESAAKAYKQAVAMDPQYTRAYQNAAWLMATCPDDRIRNTELALVAARKSLEMSGERNAENVETLAAATAAQGRMEEAAKLQREAIKLVGRPTATTEGQLAELKQRLSLYENGRAYIQPQPAVERLPSNVTRTASTSSK